MSSADYILLTIVFYGVIGLIHFIFLQNWEFQKAIAYSFIWPLADIAFGIKYLFGGFMDLIEDLFGAK